MPGEPIVVRALLEALAICIASAACEGLAAGSGVRQRFAELRMPPYSPPLGLWVVIGVLYYGVCFFVSYRLLSAGVGWSARGLALALLIVLMTLNVLWNIVFFRRKDLHASYMGFWPYLSVAAALLGVLSSLDSHAALVFLPYVIYLGYALWWSYRLWRLNGA